MPMNSKWFGAVALALAAAVASPAQQWRQVGPPGGTVISLQADPKDPNKIYLGTSDGHVFFSSDEGEHWGLLSRIGSGQDDVVTHILVDPRDSKRLYASTWTLYSGGGGVYRSDDSGRSWKLIGLGKETVRALAQAPTNPKLFVAGSLTGVYRSTDDGNTWERITPTGHEDLRNFDSLAFDPKDPNIIYAGTYHLPWKTTDGGKNWTNIKAGMIDDSDVMTMIVDPANPSNVHATACSGIYRSVDAGQNWKRYGGIPFVYRRTQLIRQDPQNPETLYAGTTSGLWKTTNEGTDQWKRMTPLDWVVNAILIDPRNPQRIIIGTERQGVQISENGGASFAAANTGFHHQHILDVAIDREHPDHALVVLTFDTNAFLATKNGGATWSTLGPGLKRTDVKHVYAMPTGWWAALNNGGLMKYDETTSKWVKAGLFVPEAPAAVAQTSAKTTAKGKKATPAPAAKKPLPKKIAPQQLAFQVNELTYGGNKWFAATTGGVLVSTDKGATWKPAASEALVKSPAQSLEASNDGSQIWAVSQKNLLYSADGGAHWEAKELAFASSGNLRLRRMDDENLFITTNMGLYISRDAGRNWNRADIRDLQFQDAAGAGNARLVALQRRGLVASFDSGKTWQRVNDPLAEGYFPLVRANNSGSLFAVSATEGLFTLEAGSRSASEAVGGSSLMMLDSNGTQKPR
jgi:photosystem II stability/assembly factor-like uncharacterized protein